MERIDAIPLPDPVLEDEEVVLCPFSDLDLRHLVEYCNDPEIARFTFVPAPYDRSHAVDFVMNQDRRRETREALDLSIRDRRDLSLLGATGLRVFDPERGSCEIGYWVAPPARRRGVATRAVRLFSAWALRTLPLTFVELTPDASNAASRGVAEKAGFELTGEVRERFAKGRRWNLMVYRHPQ